MAPRKQTDKAAKPEAAPAAGEVKGD